MRVKKLGGSVVEVCFAALVFGFAGEEQGADDAGEKEQAAADEEDSDVAVRSGGSELVSALVPVGRPRVVAVTEAVMVLNTATPMDPPTCCIVFTNADATPASEASTPIVAAFVAGAMTAPRARPIATRPGSTPAA